jgi:spore coat protein U-like protein
LKHVQWTPLRRLPLCVLAAAAAFAAAPVQAQTESLEIDISAQIVARCGFAPGSNGAITAPQDLEEAASLATRIRLDCNTPYALGVTAVRGALVNLDAADDGSGFAFSKTYGVSIALDTDRGIIRSDRCSSADLISGGSCAFAGSAAGEGLESGSGISIGRDATITVDWQAQPALRRRLAPGRYRDTLILVVGPRA